MLDPPKKPRATYLLKTLSVIVTAVIIVSCAVDIVSIFPAPVPTDDELIKHFLTHEQTYEELRAMIDKDYLYDININRGTEEVYGRNSLGELIISNERNVQYYTMLHQLDITKFFAKKGHLKRIWFTVYYDGFYTNMAEKGYYYSSEQPQGLGSSLEQSQAYKKHTYRHIKNNWYLYCTYY